MEKLISEAPSNPWLAAIDELRAKAAAEEEEARRRKPKGLPDDSDDINHLAALVDLHKVYSGDPNTAVITMDNSCFAGWAFSEHISAAAARDWRSPKQPMLIDSQPKFMAPPRIDRPATWNPLKNYDDALDFMQLYRISWDPRHTVRYVLGLKAPPKRPRKAGRPYHQVVDIGKPWPSGPLAPGLAELNTINKMTEAVSIWGNPWPDDKDVQPAPEPPAKPPAPEPPAKPWPYPCSDCGQPGVPSVLFPRVVLCSTCSRKRQKPL